MAIVLSTLPTQASKYLSYLIWPPHNKIIYWQRRTSPFRDSLIHNTTHSSCAAAMFCSSLRRRRDWAAIVPVLARSSGPGWKGPASPFPMNTAIYSPASREAAKRSRHCAPGPVSRWRRLHLQGHPPLDRRSWVSAGKGQGGTTLAARRREKRSNRASPPRAGLHGRFCEPPDRVRRSFYPQNRSRLLSSTRTLDYSIPIIPVSSAAELPACLDSLRRQLQSAPRGSNNQDLDGAARDLVSHCVRGQALSEHQTNVLTGISGGFRDLAEVAFLPANQGLVIDYLGEKDGKRLVSFLADGPALANM